MAKVAYERKDFANSVEVRWCPGCGDYAILNAIQRALPELGLAPEQHVFVSGIGCAGRLPYYMNTYGLHTIHGRATAVATGLKALRDDLCVWVITGDGDALSIGGNHLLHCLRRNVNIKIILINNEVYGLTKGQFSPTSKTGQITKTSPYGVQVQPINPIQFALGAGASFVARAIDKDPSHLAEMLKLMHAHAGCAFLEVTQDCNIFNNGAFDEFALKDRRLENTINLTAGKPLYFGKAGEIALNYNSEGWQRTASDANNLYIHDPANFLAAISLARLTFPEFPVPLGVYYQQSREQFKLDTTIKKTPADLADLYRSKASWQSG